MKNLSVIFLILLSIILISTPSCTEGDESISTVITQEIKHIENLNKISDMTTDTAVIVFIKNYKNEELKTAYVIKQFLEDKNSFLAPLTESRINIENYINLLKN
jgi:hypothetical protein